MTILLTSEIQGQTQQSYDDMIDMLREPLKQADGFVTRYQMRTGLLNPEKRTAIKLSE